MNVQLVSGSQIDEVWPSVRGHIQKSLDECDDLKIGEMYTFCRSGQGFLFVSEILDAALIMGFERRNGIESARVYAMGSEAHADWKTVFEQIRKFAYANGAEKMVFQGRKGWSKILGVKPKYYIYEV